MHIALTYCFSLVVMSLLISSYSSQLFAASLNENIDDEECVKVRTGGLPLVENLCYTNYGIFERLSNHTDSRVYGEVESEAKNVDAKTSSVDLDKEPNEVTPESYDKNPLLLALPFP
jgi:hypothetical protein